MNNERQNQESTGSPESESRSENAVYYVDESFITDFLGHHSRMKAESERGCVLVGAAILDDYLRQLLEIRFKRDGLLSSRDIEFLIGNGPMPPLRPFALRIIFCHAFYLIPGVWRTDLELIKNIRNRFGHFSGDVEIDLDELKPVTKSLAKYFDASVEKVREEIGTDDPVEIRKRIFCNCMHVYQGRLEYALGRASGASRIECHTLPE